MTHSNMAEQLLIQYIQFEKMSSESHKTEQNNACINCD